MQLIFNIRATSILYSFLLKNKGNGLWMIPVNVCHLLPACFIKANCSFEIIDCDPKNLSIDEDEVLMRLSQRPEKYSGILTVRNYGENKAKKSFFKRLKSSSPHLKIIDDACLSFPNFNSKISDFVDLELYSTGYSKPVDIGYGGFAKLRTTDQLLIDENLFFDPNALKVMNNHYIKSCEDFTLVNDQIFENKWLECKAIEKDKYIEEVQVMLLKIISHKNDLNEIYDQFLLSRFKENRLSTNWRYHIRCENPGKVLQKLNTAGLFASQHYFPLSKVFGRGFCPVWEKTYSTVLNLFNDLRFDKEKANECGKIINEFAKPLNT